MSKEKQCECCHEWWYASVIKEDLCPNCYDYFKQLKRQLEEKDKEIEVISSSKKHFKTCAENMSDILKTINSVLPKPQKNELNYKKVADDVVALIKEKDKEIERLKNLFKLNNEVVINQGKEIFDLRVQVLQQKQNQTQLAIHELEKLRDKVVESSEKIVDTVECIQDFHSGITLGRFKRIIDQQIKLLKGEKDAEN